MPQKTSVRQTIQNVPGRISLSPKELAQAIDASESSIKRWIDDGRLEADRTLGGHRKISIAHAIQFIRASQVPVLHPEVLGLTSEGGRKGSAETDTGGGVQLSRLLEEGRTTEVSSLLIGLYLAGWSLPSICDGPVNEAMERIGALWLDRSEGIFLEHRASDLCVKGLNDLRGQLMVDTGAPIAIGGAPPGDPYQIASLCAATVLAGEGFNAMNLGPNTPFETLLEGVDRFSPLLVWLSVSYVYNPEGCSREFDRFRKEMEERGVPLMVGGCERKALKFSPSGVIQEGSGMGELASFAKGLSLGEKKGTD